MKVKIGNLFESKCNTIVNTVNCVGVMGKGIALELFSYDQLTKSMECISDKDVYDFVLDWKPHWKDEKEFEVCETIHNMAMLSSIKIAHSQQLMDTMLV